MKILEGKNIAEEILVRVKNDVLDMERIPGFGAVLVGDNPASKMYIDLKKKAAQKCGMLFCDYSLSKNASEAQVLEIVDFLNNDPDIDGILVQLPLPEHLNREKILNVIDPRKDVDGLTKKNQGCFQEEEICFVCPFPKAIIKILRGSGIVLSGKKGIILANSVDFGSVMMAMLLTEGVDAEYILFQDKEKEKAKIFEADIIISAIGQAKCITADMIKDGAIIIDGGIEKQEGVIFGDVATFEFIERDVLVTPVPGGVGPVTVACLIENVLLSAKRNGNHINMK